MGHRAVQFWRCLLLLLFAAGVGPGARAQGMSAQSFDAEKPRIDALWSGTALGKEVVEVPWKVPKWKYVIGDRLPFPDPWPPTAEGKVVYYIDAVAFQLNLVDGQLLAGPWARIVRSRDRSSTVELFDPASMVTGVQGFTPVRREDYDPAGVAQEFVAGLSAMPPESEPRVAPTRAYYCLWLSKNGLLGGAYAARHPAFIDWLDCARRTK
jgi:hypothetical protein